jgi:protease-4
MGNPDKPITQEEKALMMRDIKDVYNIFLEQVSLYRGVPIDELRKVADGSSMLAKRAKDSWLIDEIGSSYDAIDYISKIIKEKAEVCEINEE